MKIEPRERLDNLFDDSDYDLIESPKVPADPLKFKDQKKYSDRIKEARNKTGQEDAIIIAIGTLDGLAVVVAVQNFLFMGGSLGMAAGEAIVKSAEIAVQKNAPLILVTAAGGARMQEGIMSLMQMPRTTIAVQLLKEAGLPYIVVLTDPTTGGVTASYAMLGDVQIAEPGALIGFAGPRVIEQTIREKLPDGFQRAEFLFEHGMIDLVVHRHDMRKTLSRLVHLLSNKKPISPQELAKLKKAKAQEKTNGESLVLQGAMEEKPAPSEGDDSTKNDFEGVTRLSKLAGHTP
jgi:acetyl-CoA carboxylase carboxyl transferase subunit beta